MEPDARKQACQKRPSSANGTGLLLCPMTDSFVSFTVRERTAAMRTTVLETTAFEKGGDGRFAVGAIHRFLALHGDVSAQFADRSDLPGGFHPYGFALVASDGASGRGTGGLAGGKLHREAEAGDGDDHGGQCFHRLSVGL